ncbi:MAG TPA: DNA repair protein RecO [Burkholderiaceae bacterium]|nr:DNA repair protein RecO [Burkholderiaceae bacterium]
MPLNAGQHKVRRQGVSESRIDQQPAFVLHTTPWRETSLIVEVLTRDFGRMGLVARGAKRPTSHFRGLLTPFSPIAVSWSGRGDIKTLIRVDWLGGLSALCGDALLAAFYLNELLVRLLARADAHEALFSAYQRALHDLARADKESLEAGLRRFELDLLREAGWLPALEHTPDGEPIVVDGLYRLDPHSGPRRVLAQEGARADPWVVSGAALHALARRCWPDVKLATQCRHLLRALIAHHLDGRPLNTRRIFQDLKRL